MKQYKHLTIEERVYAEHGENIFAACVLSSTPTLDDVSLIQIWINNSNDPRVKGLGIGELMSKTQNYSIGSGSKSGEIMTGTTLDLLLGNELSAFPNPFSNQITITSNEIAEAAIINMQG